MNSSAREGSRTSVRPDLRTQIGLDTTPRWRVAVALPGAGTRCFSPGVRAPGNAGAPALSASPGDGRCCAAQWPGHLPNKRCFCRRSGSGAAAARCGDVRPGLGCRSSRQPAPISAGSAPVGRRAVDSAIDLSSGASSGRRRAGDSAAVLELGGRAAVRHFATTWVDGCPGG